MKSKKQDQSPLFEICELSKVYPGVIANDKVSFEIKPGSIQALLGENGAGKSTLVKMIYGLARPSSGSMRLEGQDYSPNKPQMARAQGIGMVFQHFSLFEALSVAENIAVGMEEPPDRRVLRKRIKEVSQNYGLPLDPDRIVGTLSAGARQRVEIIRSLLQKPKLLIMDEPTSVLTPGEVETLFKSLRKMRDEGTSILYISHKLEEIRALCDHAIILRRGKVVGNCTPAKKSARELAEMMVGQALAKPKARKNKIGKERLELENASLHPSGHFATNLRDINLIAHSGEILGVAGVAGNGQDELLSILSGEEKLDQGVIKLDGADISKLGPISRRKSGLLAAPEERLGHAAVPDMSLTENAVLSGQERAGLAKRKWINWKKAAEFTDRIIKVFDVRTPSNHVAAKSLSGGNLQKFVVGREIMQKPEVFIVNQPTWGVDAAAAGFIRQSLRDLADAGAAVIVISQDLDELYELADNVVVLCEGRLSPVHKMKGLDIKTIGSLMGGAF